MSQSLTRAAVSTAAVGLVFLCGVSVTVGQAPSASPQASGAPEVRRSGNFSPIVESLQRSLDFYHGVLGLEIPPQPGPGPVRPFSVNPGLHAMLGTTGAKERHTDAKIPGATMSVEMIEFAEINRTPVHPRVQDPGAATLVLLVRDVDALLAHVKQSGVPVVTPGGGPVTVGDGSRAVMVQDPDGRLIEFRQVTPLPETAAPASSNIIGARFTMTVEDTERTIHVYRDLLGFHVQAEPSFVSDTALQALTGLKQGTVRRSRAQAPGSMLWIEFLEFKGVDRKPLRTRIQDPGSVRLQLMVRGIDSFLEKLKANGGTVISDGGARVALPPNLWGAIVADPNNLFLTLLEPCDGCAPRRAQLAPANP